MKRYTYILLIAALAACGGCRLMSSVNDTIKDSLNNAANDYHRVTTGGNSTYISSQHQH